MKHYQSIKYAYVWCEQLVSWDPKMGAHEKSLQTMYQEYKNAAPHFGDVQKNFKLESNVIQPVNYATWYDIFCRVWDQWGEWSAFWLDPDFKLGDTPHWPH